MTDNDKLDPTPTADERARRLREIGDASAVYGEVGGVSAAQALRHRPWPDSNLGSPGAIRP